MTGISLKAELDTTEAQQRLRVLIGLMDRKRPFFDDVGNLLVASIGRRFHAQRAPDGTPWAPLKPATIKARRRRGRSKLAILRETGGLAGSINAQTSDDEVRVGSTHDLAAIHQLGGTIEMPARAAKIYRRKDKKGTVGRRFVKKEKANHITDAQIAAHRITIPARPFLGVSAEDQTDIMAAADRWLTGGSGAAR